VIRKIVKIDESRCDGCGECIPSCAEGALYLENGKAKLAADILCDGLGACLGECPQGAIQVIEREAPDFDERAVEAHLTRLGRAPGAHHPTPAPVLHAVPSRGGGCPGSRTLDFAPPTPPPAAPRRLALVSDAGPATPAPPPVGGSTLGQWPVQLRLVSPAAPYFQGADLLVAADCVPFAYAAFHQDFLVGKRLVVGCPKLDDVDEQFRKLSAIVAGANVRSVTVVKMSVPCCNGIVAAAKAAVEASGRDVPFAVETIGLRGERL
jgi:NAD-dependent dihydropyrimidine dehydrogenase PreA subunit